MRRRIGLMMLSQETCLKEKALSYEYMDGCILLRKSKWMQDVVVMSERSVAIRDDRLQRRAKEAQQDAIKSIRAIREQKISNAVPYEFRLGISLKIHLILFTEVKK